MMGPHETAAAPLPVGGGGPLSVACPSCGAPAGQYCTSAFGCTARANRAADAASSAPASVTNVTCTGALDDHWGRHIAVLQDHDGVRIDVGGIEICLTREISVRLRGLLLDAEVDSCIWEADNTDD